MNIIVGVIIIFSCMLSGFVLAGGHVHAIWQPLEILIIVGIAIGSMVIANPPVVIKGTIKKLIKLFAPSPYNKTSFMELFALIYDITSQLRKFGLLIMEQHIEDPKNSEIFKKYPLVLNNDTVMSFMVDNLRMIVASTMKPHELEMHLDAELETYHHYLEKYPAAVNRVADACPGIGIVAAVLGIVITMSLIGGDPKELGHHVASALVGTLMGILISYGFLQPLATLIEHRNVKEMKYLECIKVFVVSVAGGLAPQVTVEFARQLLYPDDKPTFQELEEFIKIRIKGGN